MYSLPPNKLGYCGPEKSWLAFKKFFSSPSQENALASKNCLEGFSAMMPYLELIASENKLGAFDESVVEAYWIGNNLLENVSFEKTRAAVLSLQKFGLPKKVAERKAERLPEGILPHHSMHVFYVNFISQKVKPLVENLSSCAIQWASVKEPYNEEPVVNGISFFSESSELKIRDRKKTVYNPFQTDLEKGDMVTVHWNNVIEKISDESLRNLKKYTSLTLEKVNGFLNES